MNWVLLVLVCLWVCWYSFFKNCTVPCHVRQKDTAFYWQRYWGIGRGAAPRYDRPYLV